jgi:hypothetical protein
VGVATDPIGAVVLIGPAAVGGIVEMLSAASVETSSTDRVGGGDGVISIGTAVDADEDRSAAAHPVSHSIDKISAIHFMRHLAEEKPGFWPPRSR